jgi:gamma-glutamylputrescine oxidase
MGANGNILFRGGENYTRRFPSDIESFVRKYLLRYYPQLADARIDYGWRGTLAVTMNRLPSFGGWTRMCITRWAFPATACRSRRWPAS